MGLFDSFKGKLTLNPEDLAQRLYSSFVLSQEEIVMNLQDDRLRKKRGFQLQALERRRFIYLAASVAVALTAESSRDPDVVHAVPHFRRLVITEMQKRWADLEDEIDSEIEYASANYTVLLFTNPEENRGLSLDWSKEWLAAIGVEESNPAVLFMTSTAWKTQFLKTAEVLSQVRVQSYET